jgi:hypothetical protein
VREEHDHAVVSAEAAKNRSLAQINEKLDTDISRERAAVSEEAEAELERQHSGALERLRQQFEADERNAAEHYRVRYGEGVADIKRMHAAMIDDLLIELGASEGTDLPGLRSDLRESAAAARAGSAAPSPVAAAAAPPRSPRRAAAPVSTPVAASSPGGDAQSEQDYYGDESAIDDHVPDDHGDQGLAPQDTDSLDGEGTDENVALTIPVLQEVDRQVMTRVEEFRQRERERHSVEVEALADTFNQKFAMCQETLEKLQGEIARQRHHSPEVANEGPPRRLGPSPVGAARETGTIAPHPRRPINYDALNRSQQLLSRADRVLEDASSAAVSLRQSPARSRRAASVRAGVPLARPYVPPTRDVLSEHSDWLTSFRTSIRANRLLR